ncbi:MAG: DUF4968 domain-containing protein [Blastochloris sp.]|nr:DUF4968 domain-containing protein [Blastochloris sp.]
MTTRCEDVPGTLRTYDRAGRSLLLYGSGLARIALTVLAPGIVRIRLAPEQPFAPRRSWAVTPPDDAFAACPFRLRETGQALIVSTELLEIEVQRQPLRIAFRDRAGRAFCADERGIEVGDPGGAAPLFAAPAGAPAASARVACAKRIEAGEHFFGFGERTGQLEKRGRQMMNWTTDQGIQTTATDPLYIAIPFLMSVRPGLAYGVFFNTTWRSRFSIDDERPGVWLMEAAAGELDYYVLYGPQPADVSAGLGRLLGTMPLPPLWALGHHQSRWGYHSESAVRTVAETFRQHDIPCDVLHLDIDYMDGYRDFTWHAQRFPNPQQLLGDLRKQGFRVVNIIDAGVKVDPAYATYQQGLQRDMFVRRADGRLCTGYVWPGEAAFPDFARADVRAWWGAQHARLAAQGVSGIWNDMNEPTVFERTMEEGVGAIGTLALDVMPGCRR